MLTLEKYAMIDKFINVYPHFDYKLNAISMRQIFICIRFWFTYRNCIECTAGIAGESCE